MILRHCCAVLAEHTTQQWNETAGWQNVKQESELWYSNLAALGLAPQIARMAWARLALVPAAVAVNLAFLFIIVRNAPGEVWGLLLLNRFNNFHCSVSGWPFVFPLKSGGHSQPCWSAGSLSSVAPSICPSTLLISLPFQTGSFKAFCIQDNKDHADLMLCCRPLLFLDLFSWMFWQGPFLAPTPALSSAVSSQPVELPSAFYWQGVTKKMPPNFTWRFLQYTAFYIKLQYEIFCQVW